MTAEKKLLFSVHPKWQSQVGLVAVDKSVKPVVNEKSILFGEQMLPADLLNLAIDAKAHHICQSTSPSFNSELDTAALMLCDSKLFMGTPVAGILSPQYYRDWETK